MKIIAPFKTNHQKYQFNVGTPISVRDIEVKKTKITAEQQRINKILMALGMKLLIIYAVSISIMSIVFIVAGTGDFMSIALIVYAGTLVLISDKFYDKYRLIKRFRRDLEIELLSFSATSKESRIDIQGWSTVHDQIDNYRLAIIRQGREILRGEYQAMEKWIRQYGSVNTESHPK